MIKHRHHLVPKHMGGLDVEENLTPPISIELHAEFHRMLWEECGHTEDFIAWKALSGRMTGEEARIAAAKAGQQKSVLYKETRSKLGHHLQKYVTKESCSAGGKEASKALVEWQKKNEEAFKKRCSEIGKLSSIKLRIPHMYEGVTYPSKKALQEDHKMCNNKFYRLLKSGDITRLDKLIEAYE